MINIQYCDKSNLFEIKNVLFFSYFVTNVFLKILLLNKEK